MGVVRLLSESNPVVFVCLAGMAGRLGAVSTAGAGPAGAGCRGRKDLEG
jgi:hypothetical protein